MRNHSKTFRHFMIMMITGILILTGSLFCSGTANAKVDDAGTTPDGKFDYLVTKEQSGNTPGEVYIVGCNLKKGKFGNSIVYPNTIIGKNKKKYNVVGIDGIMFSEDEASYYNKIESVTIPKNCEIITSYAFYASNIKKVIFEKGSKLKKIEEYAFYTKKVIPSVTIPKSVVTIEEGAFNAGATKINFEKGSKFKYASNPKKGSYWWVNEWWSLDGQYAFKVLAEPSGKNPGRASLVNYDISENITALKIPNTVTSAVNKKYSVYSIGEDCFSNNDFFYSVTIPKSCVYIESNAFGSSYIEKVVFEKGSNLKQIGELAFSDTELTSITIPKSVERIDVEAFSSSNLTKITFESGSKLKFIGGWAFDECDLGNVYLPNNNITFDTADSENGSAFGTGDKTIYTANKATYQRMLSELQNEDFYEEVDYKAVYTGPYKITYMIPKTVGSKTYNKVEQTNLRYNTQVTLNPSYDKNVYKGYSLKFTGTLTDSDGEQYTVTYKYGQKVDPSGQGDVVLYASAVPNTYQIRYNANGGIGSMNIQDGVVYNQYIELRQNNFMKSDSVFKCWNTKPDGTGTSYKEGQKVTKLTAESSITLYAIWEKRSIKIRFSAGEGQGTMQEATVKQGETLKLPKCTFTCPGKKFYRWQWIYTNPDDSHSFIVGTYEDEAEFSDTQNIYATASGYYEFLAVWSDASGYNLTLVPNGGTGTEKKIVLSADNLDDSKTAYEIFSTDFQKEGSSLIGFQFDKDETIYPVKTIQSWRLSKLYSYLRELYGANTEVRINAVWEQKTYSIVFDETDGEGYMEAVVFKCGETAKLPKCTYEKDGYQFIGWAEESDKNVVVYEDEAEILHNTEDGIALYAVWSPVTYRIVYNANGGYGSMKGETVTYGESIKLAASAYRRPGYTFHGWSTDKTGGKVYKDQATVKNLLPYEGTVTLYARWTENDVTITFNPNGGTVGRTSKVVGYGDTCGTLPTPVRDGYEFKGWFTSKSGKIQYTSSTVVDLEGSLTLYARWQAKKITVTLNAAGGKINGNKSKFSIDTGTGITGLPGAKKENYTFDGWWTDYTGGSKVTAGTTFAKDTQIYAHWKSKSTGKVNVRLTIRKYAGAEGCIIYYSKYSDFSNAKSVKIQSSKTSLSTMISGLENGTKYYFRARQYKVKNGKKKYGKFGSTISKKIP